MQRFPQPFAGFNLGPNLASVLQQPNNAGNATSNQVSQPIQKQLMQRLAQPFPGFQLTNVFPQQRPATSSAQSNHSAQGPRTLTPSDIAALGGRVITLFPNVRLTNLPFYDFIDELQKPTMLLPKVKTYFKFHLSATQAQKIAMSRDTRPEANFVYSVQIQMRLCFMDMASPQADNLPPSLMVTVNGTNVQLPEFLPCRQGQMPKRPGLPIDITQLCKISALVPNHVEIAWGSGETGKGYCVAVSLVKRLTSDTLLQRLKQLGVRSANQTRTLIIDKLRPDADSDVATTSLRVSLMCPISMTRMIVPCRARQCTHLQCFDAKTFFMMNEKKPRWMCPVCDKPTLFKELYIDGLFVEILYLAKDAKEIDFREDGTWSSIAEEESGLSDEREDSPFRPFSRIDSPAVENTDDLIVLDSDEEETANAADKNAGKSQEKNEGNKSNDGNKSRPESQASNRSSSRNTFGYYSDNDPVYTTGGEDILDTRLSPYSQKTASQSDATNKVKRRSKRKGITARNMKELSSSSESESEPDNEPHSWKPASDSDSSVGVTKKSYKKNSKRIESDSEGDKPSNSKKGNKDKQKKEMSKSKSKHGTIVNGLEVRDKKAVDQLESDTDEYISVKKRKRGHVIESDEGSTDSYSPSEDAPDTKRKKSSPKHSHQPIHSVKLLDKRRPVVVITRCDINNVKRFHENRLNKSVSKEKSKSLQSSVSLPKEKVNSTETSKSMERDRNLEKTKHSDTTNSIEKAKYPATHFSMGGANPSETLSVMGRALPLQTSTFMGSAVPSAVMGTALPSAVMGTALPSTVMGTALPSTVMGTALPSTVMGTALPSTVMGTALPSAVMATALPSAVMATALPSAVMGTTLPSAFVSRTVLSEPSAIVGRAFPSETSAFMTRAIPSTVMGNALPSEAFMGRGLPSVPTAVMGRAVQPQPSAVMGRALPSQTSAFMGRTLQSEPSAITEKAKSLETSPSTELARYLATSHHVEKAILPEVSVKENREVNCDTNKTLDYGSDSSMKSWMFSDSDNCGIDSSDSCTDSSGSWRPNKVKVKGKKVKKKRRRKITKVVKKFKEQRAKWLEKKLKHKIEKQVDTNS